MTTFKYLGVVFDNFSHDLEGSRGLCTEFGILGRIRGFLTKEVSILVYNTLKFCHCLIIAISLVVVCYNKTRIDYSVCNIDRRVINYVLHTLL